MTDALFDPYHRWLGIPPKHQPPDYYRLLALERFEDDDEVIRDAVERQITHVRKYQLGGHAQLARKLLNELGRAKACLLDDQKRAEYDQQLRDERKAKSGQHTVETLANAAQTSTESSVPLVTNADSATTSTRSPIRVAAAQSTDAQSLQPPPVEATPGFELTTPANSPRTNFVRRIRQTHLAWKKPAVIGGSIATGLLLLLVFVIILATGNKDDAREEKPAPVANKPAPVANKPAPVANKPAPVAKQPAPVTEKSTPITVKLAPIGTQSVNELEPLRFTVATVGGTSLSGNVKFQLAGAPSGASIDEETGLFCWTPDEMQGPGTYQFSVQAVASASSSLQDEKQVVVQVNEVNSPPRLKAIADRVLKVGETLKLNVEGSDNDHPAGELIYRLESDKSRLAALDPYSGLFRCSPTAPGDYVFTVAVSDSGSPPLGDSISFKVTVEQANESPPLVNSIGMKMSLIRAGEFLMGRSAGSRRERPQHRVRITKDFYLGSTEVTQVQWRGVMGTTPWSGKSHVKEGADYPAMYVSWNDAVEFCRKLSLKEGVTYRLPTEAEWEYACRAGSTTSYSFGDDVAHLEDDAWFDENASDAGEKYAHRVGLKRPNAWGLYDMHGNVWEWCQDCYDVDFYAGSPTNDPSGPTSTRFRVYRGGGWNCVAELCRSACRFYGGPSSRDNGILGFRVARSSVSK